MDLFVSWKGDGIALSGSGGEVDGIYQPVTGASLVGDENLQYSAHTNQQVPLRVLK